MAVNITPLATLLLKQVAPPIIKKIKNKISPDELQRAILAGIKAAETEEENFPKKQHIFFNSKPDSLIDGVPGFFGKFFQLAGVQDELAKPFNDQGLLDVDYLAEIFYKVAAGFKEVNLVESRVKPWLNTFAQTYFQETNYLRFKVAKQDYFKQLNQRYDDIKFAGIAVSGQEEERKTLQQIFVMPDVVERETNKQLFPDEFIDAESNLTTNKLPEGFFKHWLTQGEALILLDGIDEVAEISKRYQVVERIASFLHQYDKNIAIITSRPSGYKRDFFSTTEFPHYQLQPFDDDKIEQFINHWYDSHYDDPQEATRCKNTLRKALENNNRIKLLAKNPLLITIIALIHRYQAYLPQERHKLYDKAVETLLISWDTKKEISGHKVSKYLDLDDLRRLLENLAYWIHSQGSTGDKEGGTQIDKDELLEWLSKYIKINKQRQLHEAKEEARRFLNFIRERTGLLNEQGTNRYAFVHKTFQEYLCAQNINYEADDEDDFEIIINSIKEHLHDAHWREVLLLLVAQQKPQKALKAIKTIYENNSKYEQWLHRDLLFAGSCLADSPKGILVRDKESLADEILKALVNLEIGDENKIGNKVRQQVFQMITSFTQTDWETKTLDLLKEQQNKIEQFRLIKYQAALGEVELAIEALLPLLKDDDSRVRSETILALGKIAQGEPQVIEALLPLLKDDDSRVRSNAASALQNIDEYKSQAIEALLPLLQDSDSTMRYSAALALQNIDEYKSQATEVLLFSTGSDNRPVRSSIGMDLQIIVRGIDAFKFQIDLNTVEFTLQNIEKSRRITINLFLTDLLSMLQDNDSSVHNSAASVLVHLGKDEPSIVNLIENWIEQNQDTNYVGNGIDVLWNLVGDEG